MKSMSRSLFLASTALVFGACNTAPPDSPVAPSVPPLVDAAPPLVGTAPPELSPAGLVDDPPPSAVSSGFSPHPEHTKNRPNTP